jgi:hypothetical protein
MTAHPSLTLQQRFWDAARTIGSQAADRRAWAERLTDQELAHITHGQFAVPAATPDGRGLVGDRPYRDALVELEAACIEAHLERIRQARADPLT